MDTQDFRSLQEAYMEIYHNELDEGKVEWDNPKRHLPSGLTPREKNRAKRISTGVENPNIKPSEKQLERYGKLKIAHDTEKGKKVPRNKRHRFSQFDTGPFVSDPELKRREKKNKLKDLKEPKESYDYYDIILSHLLDEGYAETPEAANVIMVNMSEEWREGIIEAYKPWDFGPKQKAKSKYTELLKTKQAEVSRGIPGGRGTATRANKIGRVGTEMRRTLDKDTQETGADPKKQGLQPSTRRHTEAARRRASRGLPSASTARKSYG